MTRRQIARRAFSAEHRTLMLAYKYAAKGDKLRRLRELQQWMVAQLKEAASA
jgi:hypothetical protein